MFSIQFGSVQSLCLYLGLFIYRIYVSRSHRIKIMMTRSS